MSTFEKLTWIADAQCETAELARQMIGIEELAIMISKDALSETSMKLSPTKVAKAIGAKHRQSVSFKIDALAVKDPARTSIQDKIDRLAVRKASFTKSSIAILKSLERSRFSSQATSRSQAP